MPKIYTGIGSRETPDDVLLIMARISLELSRQGWLLRSGHAPGADKAFESMAEKKEIYIPWPGFEGGNTGYIVPGRDCKDSYRDAEILAAHFHPAWNRCTKGARALHTRNIYQILGKNLAQPSKFVVCWTKEASGAGGTGQALRLARYLKIPIFDLAIYAEEQVIGYANEIRS